MTVAAGEVQRAVAKNGLVYRSLGKGTPLLLMHGGSGSWLHWKRNLPALAADHRVIAFDLPGYGESPDIAADVTLEGYAALVAAAAEEALGGEAADIVGFSFGGLIAATVAIGLGRRCRRLAMIAPSGFDAPVGRILGRKPRRDFPPGREGHRAFLRQNLLSLMLADPASVDDDAIDMHEQNLKNARFDNRGISWSDQLLPCLSRLTCPLLMVYGDLDKTPYPSRDARIARCRVVKPKLRVAVIPGAGHWAQYERAEATETILEGFFSEPLPVTA
jgi:pimeloyl-ACP methyl ester carboxylesterase